ncbi:hypothetical protein BCR36DRAFT_582740 [Piromyces finnis]|uniref:DUF567-domain-containing protein n=1 Tax=Piromyces finnis TaxID=1754191 RepID=A0A1Y1VC49_9FUNG|nr:hypothetical protein BCR36DRAFT_582740 [Piromyces finnis]|eukprot:ORX52240.1 hypothetical protein BCR36DRAFT_582740 [Piromyces finnis]
MGYQDNAVIEPPNNIVAVESRFVFNKPITLVINTKLSLSSKDFTIKDVEGRDYFRCKGNSLNITDKKVLYDLYEIPILNIKNQLLSLKDKSTIYLGSNSEKVIATINQKNMMNLNKYTLEFFNQAQDKNEFLDMKCNIMGSSCGIFYGKEKEGAPMVCKITRKINASILSSESNYYVEIAPGVDIALIVAATICFDQLKKE